MNENFFSLTQNIFPFITKKIHVDLLLQRLNIHLQTPFKCVEYSIDLFEIDENPQLVSKKTLSWLVISILLTCYTILNISLSLFLPALHMIFVPLVLGSVSGALYAWSQYFIKNYDRVVYMSRFYEGYELFDVHAKTKSQLLYRDFIARLQTTLSNRTGRDLKNIMREIPSSMLIDTFSTAYMEELLKREIDVYYLLDSLQMSFTSDPTLSAPPLEKEKLN